MLLQPSPEDKIPGRGGYERLPNPAIAPPSEEPTRPIRKIFIVKAVILTIVSIALCVHFVNSEGPLRTAFEILFNANGYYPAEFAEDHWLDDRVKWDPQDYSSRYLSDCAAWTKESSVANSTFSYDISTSQNIISLFARGRFEGTVDFVSADASASNETISVQVTLSAPEEVDDQERNSKRWWKRNVPLKSPTAKVCAVKRNGQDETSGVAIVSRRRHYQHHHRHFSLPLSPDYPNRAPSDLTHVTSSAADSDAYSRRRAHPHHPHQEHPHKTLGPSVVAHVVVVLPRGPLSLNGFESVFPNLDQTVAHGAFDDVLFGKFAAVSPRGKLSVPTLNAAQATLISAHQPIKGSFIVSEKLVLVTHNATIDANVTLISSETSKKPTTVEISTSNATITGSLDLVLSTPSSLEADSINGTYSVSATTSHSPIEIAVKSQPISSSLRLAAVTSHAPINASVPSTYEGRFTLVTDHDGSSSVVEKEEKVEDPSGHGRTRAVNVRAVIGGLLIGDIQWVEPVDEVSIDLLPLVETEEDDDDDLTWETVDTTVETEIKEFAREIDNIEARDARSRAQISLITSEADNTLVLF